MTTQPTLPDALPASVIERAYIEDSPYGLWPDNQDSNFGIHRKIFCDQLMLAVDQLQTIFNEMFPQTSTQYIDVWEDQLGLPINPPGRTLTQRQLTVVARSRHGAFTRAGRAAIVEGFIAPALGGSPTAFGTAGINLKDGVPLRSGVNGVPSQFYTIVENIGAFSYAITIDNRITIDTSALTRELLRITPAGISFTINAGQGLTVETGGARASAKAGATKRVTYAKTGGGKASGVAGTQVPSYGSGTYNVGPYGGASPKVTGIARISLGAISAPPAGTSAVLRVRARKTNVADSGALTVSLYQGSTLIEQFMITLGDTFATTEHSVLNVNNISSWSTLEVRFEGGSTTAGRTVTPQISFVELQAGI